MEYRRANTDRISHLPSEIIEKILILLPCPDAVRTSILSSDWRYKWASMSDLDFAEPWGPLSQYAKFIDECLLRHQGPIRKFAVTATRRRPSPVIDKIEQWIELVSEHDIEELQVDLGYSSIGSSSCLFKCKKLIHLELSSCLLDVPPTFEGFVNLEVLILSTVEVKDQSSIESLISKSPLLESLSLEYLGLKYLSCSNITISAPKIKYLCLRGDFEDKGICLKKSPLLTDLILHLDYCDLIKIFGDAPNLFNCNQLTHLDMDGEILTIPPTFEGFVNLKSLKLTIAEVDKSSIESLISKSPLLESLSFVSHRLDTPITVSAPKLKCVYLRGDFLKGSSLEKSPVLADMSLYLDGDSGDRDLIKILAGVPNLEKLTVDLGLEFPEHIKYGCYRGVLSTTFSHLKVMTLYDFYLEERKAIPLVIELLRSAPNLEKLVIDNGYCDSLPSKADSDFWQKEYLVGHCFMKLKVVEMRYVLCKAPEIEFAKFILSKSPILEKMNIWTRDKKQAILNRMLKKLWAIPCASPRAAITFHNRDTSRPV